MQCVSHEGRFACNNHVCWNKESNMLFIIACVRWRHEWITRVVHARMMSRGGTRRWQLCSPDSAHGSNHKIDHGGTSMLRQANGWTNWCHQFGSRLVRQIWCSQSELGHRLTGISVLCHGIFFRHCFGIYILYIFIIFIFRAICCRSKNNFVKKNQ